LRRKFRKIKSSITGKHQRVGGGGRDLWKKKRDHRAAEARKKKQRTFFSLPANEGPKKANQPRVSKRDREGPNKELGRGKYLLQQTQVGLEVNFRTGVGGGEKEGVWNKKED